jgi:hypothetical protein
VKGIRIVRSAISGVGGHGNGRKVALKEFQDLVILARLCLREASATTRPEVAATLRRLAKEYESRADSRAAALNGGVMSDIGEKSPVVQQQQAQARNHDEDTHMWGERKALVSVKLGLRKGLALVRGLRELTDDEQERVASAILEHLELKSDPGSVG